MTRGFGTASAIAALAFAACSSTDKAAGADTFEVGSTQAGDQGELAGEADDGVDAGTGTEGPPLDLIDEPTSECDPWLQDCPDGEKCAWEQIAELSQTRCVPVEPGAKPPGEPCMVFGDPDSGYDDCELGSVCSYLDADNAGICVALCGGSPAAPTCVEEFAVCQPCPDCASLCAPLCDPLAQDCPRGFACIPDMGSFACHSSDQVGTGQLGDPCEYTFQCTAGFACVDALQIPGCAGASCCSPFCSATDPSCPNNLLCVPWFDTDQAPLPDLGVCQAG